MELCLCSISFMSSAGTASLFSQKHARHKLLNKFVRWLLQLSLKQITIYKNYVKLNSFLDCKVKNYFYWLHKLLVTPLLEILFFVMHVIRAVSLQGKINFCWFHLESATSCELQLSYLVLFVYWCPAYDFSIDPIMMPF